MLSHVRLFATSWTIACQAPLFMGFPRQEHWNGLPFPSPGGLPRPGIEPKIPALQADSLPLAPPGKPQIKQCFAHKKSLKQATASVTREHGRNAFFRSMWPVKVQSTSDAVGALPAVCFLHDVSARLPQPTP